MNAPEVIIHNAKISTLDPAHPEAAALAVTGGRISAVGGEELITSGTGATRKIDLKGRRVIPGLNDSHMHLIRGGLNYNMELRWDGVPSPGRRAAACCGSRRGARRRRSGCGSIGGWTEFQFAERRMPTLEEINAGRARHAGLRPAPVRPGPGQRRGAAGLRLHAGHARPAGRRDPARQARATRPGC